MFDPGCLGRRPFLKLGGAGVLAGGALAAGGWALVSRHANLYQVRQERRLMETSVSVNVYSDTPEAARKAIRFSFARMEAVAAILTRFNPESPVGRLNRAGWLANPPPSLRAVLGRALAISAATRGDFDVTVAPVIDYFLGLERPVTLSPEIRRNVAERAALVGYRSIGIGPGGVRLLRPGMAVTLDGIAKGYVVDAGIAALRAAGVEYALIDAGGDLRAISGSRPPWFWNVGVVDPQRPDHVASVIRVRNAAVSTSGNYEIYFSADRRLFHVINPHTGFSPDHYSSVTVIAHDAMESDAMGVAAFSMELPRLAHTMAARGNEWLVFSWDGASRWRSRHLPLISGEAKVV